MSEWYTHLQSKCANWCEKRFPLYATLMKVNSNWLTSTNRVYGKVFIIINTSSFPFTINRLSMPYRKSECTANVKIYLRHVLWDMTWRFECKWLVISSFIFDCFGLIMCKRIYHMQGEGVIKVMASSWRLKLGWIKMPQRVNKNMHVLHACEG